MFVTSVTYDGDLDGIAGADAKCQAHADASQLTRGGTYRAWLSGAHANSSPARRFTNTDRTGPYVLVDDAQTVIAADWADLTSGESLSSPINITEWGGSVQFTVHAWTYTLPNGLPGDAAGQEQYCRGWNSSDLTDLGAVGENYLVDPRWTRAGTAVCSDQQSLYCFEQG